MRLSCARSRRQLLKREHPEGPGLLTPLHAHNLAVQHNRAALSVECLPQLLTRVSEGKFLFQISRPDRYLAALLHVHLCPLPVVLVLRDEGFLPDEVHRRLHPCAWLCEHRLDGNSNADVAGKNALLDEGGHDALQGRADVVGLLEFADGLLQSFLRHSLPFPVDDRRLCQGLEHGSPVCPDPEALEHRANQEFCLRAPSLPEKTDSKLLLLGHRSCSLLPGNHDELFVHVASQEWLGFTQQTLGGLESRCDIPKVAVIFVRVPKHLPRHTADLANHVGN